MDALIEEGITSFKLFMAYPGVFLSDDGQILRAMQTAAGNGGLIMMHAENGSAIDVLVQQALARGETAPYFHGVTRPWQAEQEATHRAIMLANLTGAPLYVVHVSAKQALARIAEARDAGQNVFGETCPQYLYLSLEENLGAPGFEGAALGFAPRPCGHGPRLERYSEILHMVVKEAATENSATGKRILDLASRNKGLRHPNRKEAPAFKAAIKEIDGGAGLGGARARRLSGRT